MILLCSLRIPKISQLHFLESFLPISVPVSSTSSSSSWRRSFNRVASLPRISSLFPRPLRSRAALPIAVLFSVQVVLSNSAYLHSSLAFLQMMKDAFRLSAFSANDGKFEFRILRILQLLHLITQMILYCPAQLTFHPEVKCTFVKN